MAAIADIKIRQETRPVRIIQDGKSRDATWHLFFVSDGKPMALVETFFGDMESVPAERVQFTDVPE